jgi:hypothetical protein
MAKLDTISCQNMNTVQPSCHAVFNGTALDLVESINKGKDFGYFYGLGRQQPGVENREYGRGHPLRLPRDTNFADKQQSLLRYSSLTD